MARHAKSLSQGNTAVEHLGVGVLALCFPLTTVKRMVSECGKSEKRVRDLPAALMVYYVIALSLFPGVAYQSVLRWLLGGLQWLGNHELRVASRQSLSDARQRLGAKLGGYRDGETDLAKALVPSLREGMLCLADRLFPSYGLWEACSATGAHLLWRAKISVKLVKIKDLDDGSYLAEWLPEEERKKGEKAHVVRVVEYRLKDSGATDRQAQERYRLITTILSLEMATASELAALYPQRWEIEIAIKEGKAVLRQGRITLRSKKPDLVKQEFWGMVLAHYLVRKAMAQASLDRKQDPDELSYQTSVEIIKSTLSGPALGFSP
jgi:hypothetical protein